MLEMARKFQSKPSARALLDIGIQGHEHGQRLSNSTRATADADLEISRRLHLLSWS